METVAVKSDLHRVFCENIRARREQLDLTQDDVAKLMGTTQSNYAHIENGRASPKIDVIERVADALGIPPALLLTPTRKKVESAS